MLQAIRSIRPHRTRRSFALALSILVLVCGCADRDSVSPPEEDLALGSYCLELRFEVSQLPDKDLPGVLRAGSEPLELKVSVFDEDQNEVAESTKMLSADSSGASFETLLSSEGNHVYTASIEVTGRRTRPTGITENGLLHSGTTIPFVVETNETTAQSLLLAELVPQLWILEVPSVRHELRWSPVEGAIRYRIRRSIVEGSFSEFENSGLDTTLTLAPGLSPGGNVEFRIQAILAGGVLAGMSEARSATDPGSVAPSRIEDLRASHLLPTQVRLEWSAPGDDDNIGRSTRYELRRARAILTEENFQFADLVGEITPPNAAGETETAVISGLQEGTVYYFGMVAFDEAFNRSELSNILELTTPVSPDLESPTTISDLQVDRPAEGLLILSWSAPSDARDGQASAYDIRWSTTELTVQNFAANRAFSHSLTPAAPGSREEYQVEDFPPGVYWFGLRSTDAAGNVSAPSNLVIGAIIDEDAPSPVDDLSVESEGNGVARLRWTGAGDNGQEGRPFRLEIRFARFPLDESNFELATLASDLPEPGEPGTAHEFVFSGLRGETTYWIGLRTVDEVENQSALSNLAQIETDDFESPEQIDDLVAEEVTGTRATFFWTAPGDNQADGTASLYDMRFSVEPITEENFTYAQPVGNMPPPSSGGTQEELSLQASQSVEVYLALKTSDEAGHVSELSNVVFVRFGDPPPDAPTELNVSANSDHALTLSWSFIGAEEYFEVERRAPNEGFQRIGIVDRNGTRLAGRIHSFGPESRTESSILEIKAGPVGRKSEREPGGETITVIDDSLSERTTYTYRIRAFSSGGPSGYSNEDSARTLLGAPEGLTVEAAESDRIQISWLQSRSPKSFEIERRSGSDNFATVAVLSGDERTYNDVGLAPTRSYAYRVVALAENQSGLSDELTVQTEDVDAVCLIVPELLDFGAVEVGDFKSLILQITNTGGGILSGTLVSVCDDAADFIIEEPSFSLGPGESESRAIRFKPALPGTKTCAIAVSGGCTSLSVTGTANSGPICRLDTGFMDFGTLTVGSFVEQTHVITNLGGDILVGEIEFLEGSSIAYSLVDQNTSFSLSEGENHSFTIRFNPYELGLHKAALTFGAGECRDLNIQGFVDPSACSWQSAEVDFGATPTDQPLKAAVVLQNNGATLVHVELALDCTAFSFSPDVAPFDLAPGASRLATISFNPPETGAYSCELTTNLDCPPLPLSGRGVDELACLIEPTQAEFEDVEAGTTVEKRIRITNNTLETQNFYAEIDPRCAGASFFSIVEGAGEFFLQRGGWTEIALQFSPEASGQIYSCILDLGNADCHSISILANSRPFPCESEDGPHSFGDVLVGTEYETTMYYHNDSDETLTGTFFTDCDPSIARIAAGDQSFEILPTYTHPVRIILNPTVGPGVCGIVTSNDTCFRSEISWNGIFPISDCEVFPPRNITVEATPGAPVEFNFIVTNTGTVELPLDIGFLDDESCSQAFKWITGDGPTSLPPEGQLWVQLSFMAEAQGLFPCFIDLGSLTCGIVTVTGVVN